MSRYTPPTPFREYCSTEHTSLVDESGSIAETVDEALSAAIGDDWDRYVDSLDADKSQPELHVSTPNMDIVFYEFQQVGGSTSVNAYATPRNHDVPESEACAEFTEEDRQWETYLLHSF